MKTKLAPSHGQRDLTVQRCILCWTNRANTSEHIFKADLYREMVPDGQTIYLRGEDRPRPIGGANSRKLRPTKNLCTNCNCVLSAIPDQAFSAMDKYLRKHAEELVANGPIEVTHATPGSPNDIWIPVKKYFAKALACYIHRSGSPVPRVLGKIFISYQSHDFLEVKISANEALVQHKFMENGPLNANLHGGDEVMGKYLSSKGVIASQYSYDICHSGIVYKTLVNPPAHEIIESARAVLSSAPDQFIEGSETGRSVHTQLRRTIQNLGGSL